MHPPAPAGPGGIDRAALGRDPGEQRSPTANLANLVRSAAHRSPSSVALVSGAVETTWSELDRAVDRAAAALLELGLGRGDRIALALANDIHFPVAYFGALRAGLVALPVNTAYTSGEAGFLLRDSGARVLVATRGGAEDALALRDQVDSLEVVLVAGTAEPPVGARSFDLLLGAQEGGPIEPRAGDEDVAVLLYTSGTSGRPKGAMLSHRALLADLDHVSAISPPVVTGDDVVLLVLPLFHVYALNSGLGIVARHGAMGVLIERFDPVETLDSLRRYGVTVIVGAPPMYVAWSMLPNVDRAFAGVRLAVSGSAPLPPAVLRRILDTTGHHVFEGYGLTETSPTLTSTLMSPIAKPGSIGRPVPGVELRLLDPAGAEVEEDDNGEITVRGANLFSGYWPEGTGAPDAEGWFRTGDVAYADADGDLFLVDRRTELVLVSGFNVYPHEVEQVLLAHPDVEDAAVIGIPHPYTGESVKAVVVPRQGAKLSADDVILHCGHSLARFKCPTAVEFVDELPYTPTGKVSKGQLREELAAREGES